MAITVTPLARSEILRLLSHNPASVAGPVHLRIGIGSGGCAGQVYQLDFQGVPRPGDRQFPLGDVILWIDGQSWPLLQNLTLDYSEDLMGGSFRFDNRLDNGAIAQSCNCGQSFALA